jgi:hypothetical protein
MMPYAVQRFRFTIGQGMIVIAVLAVLFASLPMAVAVNVAFAVTCLVAIGRNRLLSEPVGCILCLLGLLTGPAAVVIWLFGPRIAGSDSFLFVVIAVSSIAGGLGAARLRRPTRSAKRFAPHQNETQREFELVEDLLKRARKDGDEVVIAKLSEYRVKLKQRLQL